MKKFMIVLLVVSVFLMAFSSMALAEKGKARVGATVGFNAANTTHETSEGESKKMRPTFNAGLVFDYWFSAVMALEILALYNNKGAKFEGSFVDPFFGNYSFKETDKLAYLSFMALPRYAFGQPGGMRPYIKAGFEFGILLSAKYSYEETTDGQTEKEDGDWKDFTNSTEFAIPFGVGVEFPLGQNMTGAFQVMYSLGLTGIGKDVPDGEKNPKNKVIMVNFLFFFWQNR
jgi:opacity protein-like surface antigen